MLDLQAGVGLDEDEGRPARLAGVVDQELEGPEAAVADATGQAQGGVDDLPAQVRIEAGGRGDLHHLLEAPLDAALPLAEVGHLAGEVAQDLDLHVPGPGKEGLDIDVRHAEGRLGLGTASGVGALELIRGQDHPGTPPAAARQGLEDDALSGGTGLEEGAGLLQGDAPVEAGADRHAGRQGRFPRPGLVAEEVEVLDLRPDEGQARRRAAPGELAPLGQKAVAGVNGVAAALQGRLDHRVHVEVGGGAAPRQGAGLVGHAPVQAVGVVGREDRHRAATEVRRRPGDADGDLAAVGDQDGRQSQWRSLRPLEGLSVWRGRSRRNPWRRPLETPDAKGPA